MITLLFAVAAAMPALTPAEIPELVLSEPEAIVETLSESPDLADLSELDLLTPPIEAAANGKGCPRHIERCSAQQVGQPCHPDNLNVLCSAQANGAYCCLAYAP
jgi:hypothetical protein